MRRVLLFCLSAAFGYAANAQFTVLPKLGLETSRTSVAFNNQPSSAPLGNEFSPQAAVRFDYAFKKLHGPFIGLATSRSIVDFQFAKPESGTPSYNATRGNTQLRLEGGYQVSSKPIYFKKAPVAKSTSTSSLKSEQRTGCGKSVARSGCGSKQNVAKAKPADTRTWMRVQPSLGVAYIPGAPRSDIYTKDGATYQYNAGNWETALLSGVAFQFGKAAQARYTVSLNYIKGLSNLGTQSVTTMVGNKPTTTTVKSAASAWNLQFGVPITFGKKQTAVKQPATEKTYKSKSGCTQYKYRCGRYNSSYKSRCTRVI